MENRIEIQNAVAHMVQRGKKHISFAGDKNHCQSFFERYMAYKDAMEHFGLTEGLSTCAMPSGRRTIRHPCTKPYVGSKRCRMPLSAPMTLLPWIWSRH